MGWSDDGTVVFEKELSDWSTAQLVDELSKREGVERIDVAPHTQTVEISVFDKSLENAGYPYDTQTEGPCVILKVID